MHHAVSKRLFVALLAGAGVLGCGGRDAPPAPKVNVAGGNIISVQNGQLTVNGKSYGAVKDGDNIGIDGDTVRVNGETRTPTDK
jgi:hypothetical protein